MTKNAFVLVGYPCSGKSNFLKNFENYLQSIELNDLTISKKDYEEFFKSNQFNKEMAAYYVDNMIKDKALVINHDMYLEGKANQENISYLDAFKKYAKESEAFFKRLKSLLLKQDFNIILDQTHIKKNKRIGLIDNLYNSGFKVHVVYFEISFEECLKRNKKRQQETGKYIPFKVLEEMKGFYCEPTIDETKKVTTLTKITYGDQLSMSTEVREIPIKTSVNLQGKKS